MHVKVFAQPAVTCVLLSCLPPKLSPYGLETCTLTSIPNA